MRTFIYRFVILLSVVSIGYIAFGSKPFLRSKALASLDDSSGTSEVRPMNANYKSSDANYEPNTGTDSTVNSDSDSSVNNTMPDLPVLSKEEVFTVRDCDIVFGNHDSGVRFFDYSSITCVHCAHFLSNIFPKIEEDFIKTGKILYIKRLIPSNGPALKASMVMHCVKDKQKRYGIIKALMRYQDEWINGTFKDYKKRLKQYSNAAGLAEEEFDRCFEDDAIGMQLYNGIVQDAKAINIQYSPSLYVNGEAYNGNYDYDDIKMFIEKHLESS